MKNIQLIAFLGNYGKKYDGTRHNVAWEFAKSLQIIPCNTQKKFQGHFTSLDKGTTLLNGIKTKDKVFFLWPETYMNLSGQSVSECAKFYKIKPENILVVHDELELAPGFVSLKWSGGLGGHNGLRSMKSSFGTADFWRLRFGIGRPNGVKEQNQDIAGYVLSSFTKDESILLSQTFMQAEELITSIIVGENPQNLLEKWKKVKLVE
ncbi:MAG: aminoacyl-tRNA hydrolase [Treponema sp. CETP13]|nr:MAG: aminoacyl-tRNA hydrolase [Treponema sp. CETP13]